MQREIARKPRQVTKTPGRRGKVQVSPEVRERLLQARRSAEREDGVERSPWTKESWLLRAQDELEALLRQHDGNFTTAEHLWPLLPDPRPDGVDIRCLSTVITRAIRTGLIVEAGAIRLRGEYPTLDGTIIKENKFVAVYRRGERS